MHTTETKTATNVALHRETQLGTGVLPVLSVFEFLSLALRLCNYVRVGVVKILALTVPSNMCAWCPRVLVVLSRHAFFFFISTLSFCALLSSSFAHVQAKLNGKTSSGQMTYTVSSYATFWTYVPALLIES